jgi:two-component system cell cycle response regulator
VPLNGSELLHDERPKRCYRKPDMNDGEDHKILVVEDTRTQALMLKMALENLGYRLEIASNGLEALDRLEREHFPLVVTDWIMPEMDGVEFCRAVRARELGGYVYIILLTAKESKKDVLQGLDAGADDYLVKPIDFDELAMRLKTGQRIFKLEQSLIARNKEIERLSIFDALTEIYNRRYFNDTLPSALKRAVRYQSPFTMILCDIDHFKRVNDQYGHQAGDKVLSGFAAYLNGAIRDKIDWVARYGGEEFAILLPETGFEGGRNAAERYRQGTESLSITTDSGNIDITASFGVAAVEKGGGPAIKGSDDFIRAADVCLYQAKAGGRNRCEAISLGFGSSVAPE